MTRAAGAAVRRLQWGDHVIRMMGIADTDMGGRREAAAPLIESSVRRRVDAARPAARVDQADFGAGDRTSRTVVQRASERKLRRFAGAASVAPHAVSPGVVC